MKNSNLIFWETIAALACIPDPQMRAEQVMKKWGCRSITPDSSKAIIADLISEKFPAHLTGANLGKIIQPVLSK